VASTFPELCGAAPLQKARKKREGALTEALV